MSKVALGELIDFKNGKAIKQSSGKIPIYGGNGILGYTDVSNYENTIIIGRVGAYCGSVHMEKNSCWVSDNAIAGIVSQEKDLKFFYYLLKSLGLNSKQIGSSQPLITQTMLKNMVVDIELDLQKQKLISVFLDNIDQKIALNNQINEELEAMAKTLYDYWFVQFEFPDENGNPYKSSGGKMVYNDQLKREIPEGWGGKRVSEVAKTGSGGTPKSTINEYYSNGTIPWINSGELNKSIIISTTNYITERGLENSSAKLFPANSILIAMYGATAGKVSFLTFESSTNQAICAVTLDDSRLKYYFKFFIEDLYLHLVTLSSGSARDNLSQELIRNLLMTLPDDRVVENFFTIVNTYFLQITNNLKQNQELTQLRDWLLPMLMNGQVKVEER
ncbi:TPA: restriction endonuclease subunit S [Streptococcus suis]|nr:restriction endonuclease subunit S [Streptococcus suis]